ncbi:MAG TPA: hypothetical protein VKP65_08850, partial [Rhodothermales bacterium]|nr:hypothetical protein [Rhodothermales bacterium]
MSRCSLVPLLVILCLLLASPAAFACAPDAPAEAETAPSATDAESRAGDVEPAADYETVLTKLL